MRGSFNWQSQQNRRKRVVEQQEWHMNANANRNPSDLKRNEQKAGGFQSNLRRQLWTVVVGAVLLTNSAARAALDIPIGTSYNGTPPTSPAPWVDLSLVDVAPNTVRLTITAAQLSSLSYIQNLFFNFDD